jgi:hypothetical protein
VAVTDPTKPDIVLTIAARGVSARSWGQRTTMEFYDGVVLATTVPTVAVTRWVSMVLSVAPTEKSRRVVKPTDHDSALALGQGMPISLPCLLRIG